MDLYFEWRSGSRDDQRLDRRAKTFGWPTRLKYGLLAAGGSLVGGLDRSAFPLSFLLPGAMWMATPASCPNPWPKDWWCGAASACSWRWQDSCPWCCRAVLLVPPRWIVRWRVFLIPAAPLAAILSVYRRMGLLNVYHFRHPRRFRAFFFTAPNFFVDHLRPGGDVGVCGAGAAPAAVSQIVIVTVLMRGSLRPVIGRLSSR